MSTEDESKRLIEDLRSAPDGQAVETRLHTDEQVIARVTDGIYRQPASAFRELIANAYDADATEVTVKTDAPRFKRISIEDNGNGMGEAALVNLLHHIGGSAKRTELGESLGIAMHGDPLLSPGGRKLIGKIGIGLFSVSQLTRAFHIITKTRGATERLIASVVMRQFDGLSASADYESGKVKIWKESVSDTEAHGTTIVLDSIRESARQTLSSSNLWLSLKQARANEPEGGHLLPTPTYFIGSSELMGDIEALADIPKHQSQSLPWQADDDALTKFSKLVDAVWKEAYQGNSSPRLDSIFDVYLQVIWQLSLSVPLKYIESHPFEEPAIGWDSVFAVSNKQRAAPAQIDIKGEETARSRLPLTEGTEDLEFSVMFDGLELRRPLKFKNLPKSHSRIECPIMFFGKCEEHFANQLEVFSAGPLKFEAYLMWAPKILPVDHQGVLIRINGASGTLFDTSFMKYQTAEIVRMRQISCEIFVQQGLEAALNIDRESLNTAHPHTVFLAQWLHSALRQVTSTQKRLAASVRAEQRVEERDEQLERITRIVNKVRKDVSGEDSEGVQTVLIAAPTLECTADFVIDEAHFSQLDKGRDTARRHDQHLLIRRKTEAIANVLAAYGLLDNLTAKQRVSILKAILDILNDGMDDE